MRTQRRAVGAICALLVAMSLTGCGQSAEEKAKDGAADVCKQYVKDRLKSPTTAEFTGLNARKASPYYIVEGQVDAENSFGAKLRSSFSCTVEPKNKKASSWKLLGIDGLDE